MRNFALLLLALLTILTLNGAARADTCDYVIKPVAITLKHQFDNQTQDNDTNEVFVQLSGTGQYQKKINRGLSYRPIEKSEIGRELPLCQGGRNGVSGTKCGSLELYDQVEDYAQFSYIVFERDDPWYYVNAEDATILEDNYLSVGKLQYEDISRPEDIAANRRVSRGYYETDKMRFSYWANVKFEVRKTCDCAKY